MSDLHADIVHEQRKAAGYRPCDLCDYILSLEAGITRDALRDAAAGTLSERALVRVLAKHKTGIGRRTVARHRSEEHKP